MSASTLISPYDFQPYQRIMCCQWSPLPHTHTHPFSLSLDIFQRMSLEGTCSLLSLILLSIASTNGVHSSPTSLHLAEILVSYSWITRHVFELKFIIVVLKKRTCLFCWCSSLFCFWLVFVCLYFILVFYWLGSWIIIMWCCIWVSVSGYCRRAERNQLIHVSWGSSSCMWRRQWRYVGS